MFKDINTKKIILIVIGVILLVSGFLAAIIAAKEIDEQTKNICNKDIVFSPNELSANDITETNGVRHSYPIEDIDTAPIPENVIPALTSPSFVSAQEASLYLQPDSPGLGIELNGDTRFYPNQILVWHAAINDCIDHTPILVGFCPLCLTSAAYSREVNGEEITFAVSNRVFNDNILVINEKQIKEEIPDLWSTVLGEQILGDDSGTLLKLIPAKNTTFAEWERDNPNTKVLSSETGFERPYETNPYKDTSIFESIRKEIVPGEIAPTDFVFGIEVNDTRKAYSTELLKEQPIEDIISNENVMVQYDEGKFEAFTFDENGKKIKDIDNGAVTLWFVWEAVYPNTLVYY